MTEGSLENLKKSKRYLSVRSRVLLTVFFGLVILYSFLYLMTNEVLSKSYLEIEKEEVIQDIDRATEAINDEVYLQYENLLDWSPWDDMYFYTEEYALEGTKNREFEESTMFATGYIRQDQNGYFVTDNGGNIYYAVYLDLDEEIEVASSTIVDFFEPQPELIIRTDEADFKYGLVMMPEGPALFASKPSLTNEETGPVHSSIALLRYLDDGKMQSISEALGLQTEIFEVTASDLPADVQNARELLLSGEKYVVSPKTLAEIQGYALIDDVYDEPALIVRIETARPIFAQGQKTIFFFLIGGFLALIVFAVFITGLLEKLVIRRFVRLSRDVETINKERNIENLVETGQADDIGKLGIKINQMLLWLSSAQKAEKSSKQKVLNLLKQVEKGKDYAEQMVIERTKELETEKARLLTSINSLVFGFLIIDTDNKIILHNPAAKSILSIAEIPARIDSPDFGELCQVFTQLVVDTKKSKTLTEIKEQLFKNFYLRLVCVPVLAIDKGQKKNEIIGYVLVIDDITEAKNTERSREEFFSIASHELRTPLTAIRWNTHMLLSEQAAELEAKKKQRLVTDVHNASIRLISIVDDFLEVSRLEQKKLTVTKTNFDMVELAKHNIETYTEYAKQKSINLEFKSSLETAMTYADEARTKQVLDNLIGNSLRFTHQGTITLEITANNSTVTVRVTDTGLGISEKNKGRLFKKFQQAGEDMLAREDSQSTGLGLYISKLVLGEMGGTIKLEKSILGEGSTFSFTLPKAKSLKS
ncbi:MAG: ATP-binding protein [Patescibacteria group bacterium]